MRGFSPAMFTAARRRTGMSRAELARLAGLSAGTVTAWETGRAGPQADTLALAVAVLGVTIADVVPIPPGQRHLGDLRVRVGLTQTQLAAQLGVSPTTLAMLERGEVRLRPEVAVAIAAKLQLQPDEITAAHERTRLRPALTTP